LLCENRKLVVVTPAMPEGNCLSAVQEEFPKRVFDVGICEQHAVTFCCRSIHAGIHPGAGHLLDLLQRSFDQIIHDVCLQELPVVFAVDAPAGIVGVTTAKTHQGISIFPLSFADSKYDRGPPRKTTNELQHICCTRP